MKIKINFGIIRIAIVRSIFLFSLMTFAMVLIDFVRTHGWQWWYLAIPFFIVGWWYFDMAVVWRQEVNATFTYSKEFQEVLDHLREMKKNNQTGRN